MYTATPAHADFGSVGDQFGFSDEQKAKLEEILKGHVHMVKGLPHIDLSALLQLITQFSSVIGPLVQAILALFHPPAPNPNPNPAPAPGPAPQPAT